MFNQEEHLAGALRSVEALLREACQSSEPQMGEMARKALGGSPKRLRPRIMLLSYAACGGGTAIPEVLEAAAGMELIHTATLVHDDIIDRGDTRRGHLATQREYGLAKALVAGDFLFIKGFELAGKLDGTVVGITARACQRLAEGELLEIQCLGQRDLDLARYLRIIEGKTASVLEACGRIGAHLAGRDDLMDALGAYGHHLGMAFQITDDLLDLRGDPAVTGKPRGTDLRTGAPNAPVLLGLRNGARARLEAMLAQGLERQEDVDAAIEVILASGAMQEAERLAQEHGARAVEALAAVPDGPAKQALADHVRALPRRGR